MRGRGSYFCFTSQPCLMADTNLLFTALSFVATIYQSSFSLEYHFKLRMIRLSCFSCLLISQPQPGFGLKEKSPSLCTPKAMLEQFKINHYCINFKKRSIRCLRKILIKFTEKMSPTLINQSESCANTCSAFENCSSTCRD